MLESKTNNLHAFNKGPSYSLIIIMGIVVLVQLKCNYLNYIMSRCKYHRMADLLVEVMCLACNPQYIKLLNGETFESLLHTLLLFLCH